MGSNSPAHALQGRGRISTPAFYPLCQSYYHSDNYSSATNSASSKNQACLDHREVCVLTINKIIIFCFTAIFAAVILTTILAQSLPLLQHVK